jgi:hypothetical protein
MDNNASEPMLQEKAKNCRYFLLSFQLSNGWLDSFTRQNKLFIPFCEAAAIGMEVVEE